MLSFCVTLVNFTVIGMRNLMMFMVLKRNRTAVMNWKKKRLERSRKRRKIMEMKNSATRHHVLDKNGSVRAMLRGYEGSGLILSINSWAKFKWFEANFGWGPPVIVVPAISV
nr:hypothetical protein [Tanacetum cinerariifolium]